MEKPYAYRNKGQFPVGVGSDGKPVLGFYAGRTHRIVPTDSCMMLWPGHEAILTAVRSWMEENGAAPYEEETGKGLVRHILMRKGFATGEIAVCLVINGEKIIHTAHQVRTAKRSFNRLARYFEDPRYPEIMALAKRIRRTNGEEGIELYNGGIIEFSARSRQAAEPWPTSRCAGMPLSSPVPGSISASKPVCPKDSPPATADWPM